MTIPSPFPQPWRALVCGDCIRIIDANGRHLFDVAGDEFAFGDEEANPDTGTVFMYGTPAERAVLCRDIMRIFPEAEEP